MDPDALRDGGADEPRQAPSRLTVQRAPQSRTFGGMFDLRDPIEFLGAPLRSFRQNQVVELPEEARSFLPQIRDAVYEEAEQRARKGHLGPVEVAPLGYKDIRWPQEAPRPYLQLRHRSLRGTEVTSMFRCYAHGTASLYLAMDSFVLGRIAWQPVVLRGAVTGFLAILFLTTLGHSRLSLLTFLLLALASCLLWGRVLRAARTCGLSGALRAVHPAPIADSSFDMDDTMMHLKTAIPAAMDALLVALKRFGLDTRSVEELLAEVTKNVQGSITINNHGSMSGVAVGGRNNTARS